ncbi:MAG: hypothetical protein J6K49_05960 [Clostridia bacterium]|nr:hypothetical protein [Clostridia bacterium]
MLYKKNSTPSLNDGLFKNPTSEYRGTPFWAWNNMLTAEELQRQIDVFKEMGLGGFHMHVRTGLKNKYLSDEYMELVKTCVEKAKKEDMLAWLYDEDRWPSGAAGGLVTCDERFRARSLLFTTNLNGEAYRFGDPSRSEASRSGNGALLACYDVILDKDGYLESYKRINAGDEAEGTKWYALLEIYSPNSWHNDQTYLDTLNKDAIERFIEVTHEKYKDKVGYEFDKTVPAIFTDEPQFTRKQVFENSFDKDDVFMPWTDKVPELYEKAYGADIFETLPEIFWDLPKSAPSIHRYRYHDFIAELFAQSFADTVGSWCGENGIALTGHMMEEPTLHSQTAALGEAMRSYRSFQLPGIDLLCNSHEFTTAKQAQSAAHQFGYEGVLSELYGVTGWDCDFRTYKHQGDWQAALGITIRVPHLSWYAMAGEAKRDYPASISYQSPWYKEYNAIEDHFARVNTALTRGKPVVKVGVIHPVESFWLHWGPNDKSNIFRDGIDEKFLDLTKWLLEGSIDFDFISESLLPTLCEKGTAPLKVGKMEYDTIIVPGCETLRSSTLERLEEFRKNGGRLLFLGEAPALCDAVVSDRGKKLYDISEKADYTRSATITAMEKDKLVTIRSYDGTLTDNLIYQLRQDEDCKWLFICYDKEPYNKDVERGDYVKITVEGEYSVLTYNTENGNIYPAVFTTENGKTVIDEHTYGYDSRLYKLVKAGEVESAEKNDKETLKSVLASGLVDYELSEENILLLDMAEFKIEGEEEFSPAEEILRLDNICRERLGLKERGGAVVQPWVYGEQPHVSKVTLKYTFNSEIDYSGAFLALEDAKDAEIVFNGEKVPSEIKGTYVDISIFKIALPDIKKGENVLEITYPFGPSANLESVYILGYFGVKVAGRYASITSLPEKLAFGSALSQGLPFYSGAITYKIPVKSENGKIKVSASDYRGALISVELDGEKKGNIIYPPYELEIKDVVDGEHTIGLKLYIHRYNSMGPVHLVDVLESWHGPDAWRSEGINWSYEYVLRTTGILKAPDIIK